METTIHQSWVLTYGVSQRLDVTGKKERQIRGQLRECGIDCKRENESPHISANDLTGYVAKVPIRTIKFDRLKHRNVAAQNRCQTIECADVCSGIGGKCAAETRQLRV